MRNAIILLALILSACSNYSANLPSIKPYKMDIQQGNVVTPKMMMQLRPGMTKQQVRYVMGTPLIADSFHANRWDYFYQMRKGGKVIEQRRVILEFEDDKLKRVRGDVVPAGSGAGEPSSVESPAGRAEPVTIKPAGQPAKEKEKGMLDKLKFWKDDEKAAPSKPESKPAAEAQPEPVEPAVEEQAQPLPPLTEPERSEAPAPKVEAKPEPRVEPKPTTKPEVKPVEAAKPAQEEKGMLDKLKFWKDDAPKPAPQPEAKPAPAPKPEPRVEPKPAPQPVVKPVEAPKAESSRAEASRRVESKPVPKPADDLPPEEDPGYFEKMLEKIGF